jgi:Fe-S cluster assembly scaffold protein SufB
MSTIELLANKEYKYGFVTDIESDTIPRGLNEDTIRLISAKKNEPAFMLEFRLKAYRHWLKMTEPRHWPNISYPEINYQDIIYYSAPKQKIKKASLDEVDPELLRTFEKLGIPLSEQKQLAGVAVDAVFDSVSVATTYKEKLKKHGVIFCSFSEAVHEHPELIKKYLGTVVPTSDNYFAALNSAVFTDGSFCFIPKGVRCPMELSTYFRINNSESGQFERTLIIAEEGAYVSYLEGCLPAGEQVLTPTGWRNIEGLKPGDMVYDHMGSVRKVKAAMTRHHKGEMITIRPVSNYKEFKLTPEHPVLAIKRRDVLGDNEKLLKGEASWIPAGELERGDYVLIPKLTRSDSTAFTNAELELLLGYYLAEENSYYNNFKCQYANRFSFGILQEDLTGRISSVVEQVVGNRAYVNKQPDQNETIFYSKNYFGHLYAENKKWNVVRETDTHFIVPIKEISRRTYDDLVFNIDVDETHSYLARGIAVHNCTAPRFDKNQLHAAVVELVALDDAEIKYSTVQNWYAGDEEGRGGIYNFVTKRGKCAGRNSKISWTQVETGSAITWKYPSCILQGDNSIGEFYSVALTNHAQQADTGTKMIHLGKNTRSTIISKGISAGKSKNSYRGLVKVMPKAIGARNYTQCDSMLIGSHSSANTFPYIEVMNNNSKVEHEATTSRISEEQLFYLMQRGISQEDAISLIINGFCKEVFRELPMEFAVEAQRLLGLKLEGSVG